MNKLIIMILVLIVSAFVQISFGASELPNIKATLERATGSRSLSS